MHGSTNLSGTPIQVVFYDDRTDVLLSGDELDDLNLSSQVFYTLALVVS